MTRDIIVTTVLPVRNEEKRIGKYLTEIVSVLGREFNNFELIVVDDGSTDATVDICRRFAEDQQNVRLFVLSRRYGLQVAMTAGLDHAIGDFVVLLSANLQDPADFIPTMVAHAQGGYDIVYAARPLGKSFPVLHRLGAALFYQLSRRLTGLELSLQGSDFRVLSRRVVNAITRLKEHNRFMRMLYAYVGFRTDSIPELRPRTDVPIQCQSLSEKIRLALDAIIAFSDRPLRYVGLSCLAIALLALFGFVWVIVERLLSDSLVEGWASMMAIMLLMFSLLFLFLAVISEYISRILIESKGRPLYYIREEYGSTNFKIANIVEAD